MRRDFGCISEGYHIDLAGCGIRLKIEARFGIIKISEIGCGMILQRRDRDKLHFEGGIWDKTTICGIVNQLHTSVFTKEGLYFCSVKPWYLSLIEFQQCKAKV